MSHMAHGGKFGWFLGLVFGTLFGVLFAPRKGKELRQKMKAERKRGKLGISPLQDDLKSLGAELASIAKDIYYSDAVHQIVEKGRKQVKELKDDFVGEVADFHRTRIAPVRREAQLCSSSFVGHAKEKVDFVKTQVKEGKHTLKEAKKEWKDLTHKVKKSARIGKKAFGEIKSVIKKKGK